MLLLAAILLSLSCATAIAAAPEDSLSEISLTPIKNSAFFPGEKLTFGVSYQFIRVGSAIMEIMDTTTIRNRPAIHIQTRARSASFFDSFYRVRDEVNSYMDREYYNSLKFEKKLREGDYYFDLILDYDYPKRKIFGQSIRYEDDDETKIRKDGVKTFEVDITQSLLDVLASFYYIRLKKLEPGIPVTITSNDNEKIYSLKVFIQRKEILKTDVGKFHTLLVVPKLQGDSVFKQEGAMWIWLTDDQYKIPLKVESALSFGSIYIEIEKIEGHKLPLPAQIR